MYFPVFDGNLCNINMKVADQLEFKSLLLPFLKVLLRHTADVVMLKKPVKRKPCQLRNDELQRVQTIVRRQKGMLTKGDKASSSRLSTGE
jgi:hypothetical protein